MENNVHQWGLTPRPDLVQRPAADVERLRALWNGAATEAVRRGRVLSEHLSGSEAQDE